MSITRTSLALVLVAVLATASVANVAGFFAIELGTGEEYEAVRVKAGHSFAELVSTHFDSTRTKYEIHAQLRAIAPGADYALADADLLTEEVVGLGLGGEVSRTSAPPPTIDGELARRLDETVVATGEFRELGPYAITVAPGPVESMTVVQGPERVYVADDRLLPDAVGADP